MGALKRSLTIRSYNPRSSEFAYLDNLKLPIKVYNKDQLLEKCEEYENMDSYFRLTSSNYTNCVAISHQWESKSKPYNDDLKLIELSDNVLYFYDFSSIPQKHETIDQKQCFKAGLEILNALFSMKPIMIIRPNYFYRYWCYYEYVVCMLFGVPKFYPALPNDHFDDVILFHKLNNIMDQYIKIVIIAMKQVKFDSDDVKINKENIVKLKMDMDQLNGKVDIKLVSIDMNLFENNLISNDFNLLNSEMDQCWHRIKRHFKSCLITNDQDKFIIDNMLIDIEMMIKII